MGWKFAGVRPGTGAALSRGMTRFALRLALPLLLVAAAMKPARADVIDGEDPVSVVPLTPAPPARIWYGWQVLATDGALAAVTAAALAGDQEDLGEIALLGLLVSGPIVHGVHGKGTRALASLGLRIGLPLAGGLIGLAIADCPPRDPNAFLDLCGVGETALGALGGMAAAITIDSIWAYEDAAVTPSPTPAPRPSWSVTPTVKVSETSAGIGLAGRF